nr:RagB/SusD family nutrient uptake outer membrane protein [uncultured Draconibacterium sp.]
MKSRLILIYFSIIFVAFACTDNLDLFPKTAVSDGSFWNSEDDYELAVNSLYNTLPGRSIDLDSDTQHAENDNAISSGTNLVKESENDWNDNYSRIRSSTYIIEKAKENEEVDASRYVAEARFFRAFYYYNLLVRYGGVPIIDKVLNTDSEELYSSRASRKELVSFIIDDLELAEKDLPLRSHLTSSDEIGRITKGAANALMAKVALFEATWSKYNGGGSDVNALLTIAKSASKAVISSNEFELLNRYGSESYRHLFMDPDADDNSLGVKPEQILAKRFREEVRTNTFAQDIQLKGSPTKKLMDMYLCVDGLPIDKSPLFKGYGGVDSEFDNRDLRMNNSVGRIGDYVWRHDGAELLVANKGFFVSTTTGYRLWKYQTEGESRLNRKDYNDQEIIRYAEVLLIYAEASYELAGSITDSELNESINLLRQRAEVHELSNGFVSTNNLNMLEEIRRERTVELAMEGERLLDLKRWGIAVEELSKEVLGIQYDNSAWKDVTDNNGNPIKISDLTSFGTNEDGFVIVQPKSSRTFSERNYLFPIPLQEIQLNENLTQNPNW